MHQLSRLRAEQAKDNGNEIDEATGSSEAGPRSSGSVGWGRNKWAASQLACALHQGLRDFWSEL